MNPNAPKKMAAAAAREWMKVHWDADETGADLNYEILDEAFEAVFSRRPDSDEDAFSTLKNHFLSH